MQPLSNATSSKVTLAFSYITLTASVHLAVADDTSSGLNFVCQGRPEGTPHAPVQVKQRYLCPHCEQLGTQFQFPKARAVDSGYVVVPQEELDKAKAAAAAFKENVLITAHPAAEVTGALMPSGKSYYLKLRNGLEDANAEAYAVMAALIKARPDLALMTRMTLRSSVSLFRLDVAGDGVLVLRQMADADLVRVPPVAPKVELGAADLDTLMAIADRRTVTFDPVVHGVAQAQKVIPAYVAAQSPVAAGDAVEQPAGGSLLSLMEKLSASLHEDGPRKSTRRPAARTATSKTSTTGTATKSAPARKAATKTSKPAVKAVSTVKAAPKGRAASAAASLAAQPAPTAGTSAAPARATRKRATRTQKVS